MSTATTNWAASLWYLNQNFLVWSHTCRRHFFNCEFRIGWRIVADKNRGGVNPVSAGTGSVVQVYISRIGIMYYKVAVVQRNAAFRLYFVLICGRTRFPMQRYADGLGRER